MKKLILAGLLVQGLFAGGYTYTQRNINSNGYRTNDSSNSFTERVQVQSSEPNYRNVIKRVPYQECYDEEVQGSSVPMGSLLGGALGGVLGHQVGKGRGKTAATIGGAVLGTMMGSKYNDSSTTRTQRKCVTKYNETQETVISGYKNIAYFGNHRIVKYSTRKLREIVLYIKY